MTRHTPRLASPERSSGDSGTCLPGPCGSLAHPVWPAHLDEKEWGGREPSLRPTTVVASDRPEPPRSSRTRSALGGQEAEGGPANRLPALSRAVRPEQRLIEAPGGAPGGHHVRRLGLDFPRGG